MKKVVIIAPTGMLGSMVYNVLKDKYELTLIYRDEDKLNLLKQTYGEAPGMRAVKFDINDAFKEFVLNNSLSELFKEIGEVDAVINCAGVIKPYSTKDPAFTYFANGVFPHLLANEYGERLIHITTDCAFNGTEGAPYDEDAIKNATDLYGLSKTLGEPGDRSLVLRTSIIGPEITGFVSLIEWFKKQDGNTIKGFSTHLWNGVTTREFGNICDRILQDRDRYPKKGLFHIFSSDINKYEMLLAFKEKYDTNVTIEEAKPDPVDRRLRTKHELCASLEIPSFSEMIKEL